MSHLNCKDHIKSVWTTKTRINGFKRITSKLDVLPPDLHRWNKTVFGNIEEAKLNLKAFHNWVVDKETLKAINDEEINLDDWLKK